jgi:hypothetical protein
MGRRATRETADFGAAMRTKIYASDGVPVIRLGNAGPEFAE